MYSLYNSNKIEIKIEKSNNKGDIKIEANEESSNKEKKIPQTEDAQKINKNTNRLFNYFIISTITLIGIILIMDTLKFQIANIFPGIIPIFDSFYQTLLDFKLFFKDLSN